MGGTVEQMEVTERLESNRAMSRLEARLALELALEARFPRLIQKKPIYAGVPIGWCAGVRLTNSLLPVVLVLAIGHHPVIHE